ncbi:MAG: sigma-70 family RNA polymerase sigma factor [Planctomycetota bacterium]
MPARATPADVPPGRAPSYPLTARIHAGDTAAFSTFYEAWFDRLVAMARLLTRRDETFCLDVVQECLLRVVRKMPALASEDAVAAWLVRTILRAAADRLRADKRRLAREDVAATLRPPAHPASDDAALDAEERTWLRHRLADLPEGDRRLLLARFGDGDSLAAVGERFGITGDAAHGRIRRLILRLKDAARGAFDA